VRDAYFTLIQTARRMGLMLLLLMACRLLFLAFNADRFSDIPLSVWTGALRIDLASLLVVFLPYHLFTLLAIWYSNQLLRWAQHLSFTAGAAISTALNCIDIAYYRFTLKRSTADLLDLSGYSDDLWVLFPQFLLDYYPIAIIFLLFVSVVIVHEIALGRMSVSQPQLFNLQTILKKVALSIAYVATFVIAGRGGLQYSPLDVIDASKPAGASFTPLVLNSCYSFFRTIGQSQLQYVEWMPKETATAMYQPLYLPDKQNFNPLNVVVIIMESFGKEFTDNPSLTPNFNRIKAQGLSFERCYANGKKSIDALPAILSGIPGLMESPFISSPYAANNISSIASHLGDHGYSTSFFHGGMNGTMNFDGYCSSAGIDRYYGRKEYGLNKDYDNAWGIYDGPFFDYFASALLKEKAPFFSCFFSLSSHHPYPIPPEKQNIYNRFDSPLENSVAYADACLGEFMEQIKAHPAFHNTLFVFTADHTPDTRDPCFGSSVGQMAIPLIFYAPKHIAAQKNYRCTQQIDIMPTLLDIMNFRDTVFSFGQSVFSSEPSFTISYSGGGYQWIDDTVRINFQTTEEAQYYSVTDTCGTSSPISPDERQKKSHDRLRAFIQTYNSRLINNQMQQ
jgi:phosphoglycerol transferase MdoB-like AlkP superfamily enzyme